MTDSDPIDLIFRAQPQDLSLCWDSDVTGWRSARLSSLQSCERVGRPRLAHVDITGYSSAIGSTIAVKCAKTAIFKY